VFCDYAEWCKSLVFSYCVGGHQWAIRDKETDMWLIQMVVMLVIYWFRIITSGQLLTWNFIDVWCECFNTKTSLYEAVECDWCYVRVTRLIVLLSGGFNNWHRYLHLLTNLLVVLSILLHWLSSALTIVYCIAWIVPINRLVCLYYVHVLPLTPAL